MVEALARRQARVPKTQMTQDELKALHEQQQQQQQQHTSAPPLKERTQGEQFELKQAELKALYEKQQAEKSNSPHVENRAR